MKKKEITYTGLVKVMMAKARKETSVSGKPFDTKSAFSAAAARWKFIKDGSDAEFSQGKQVPGMKRVSKKQKGMKKDASRDSASQFKMNEALLNKADLCDDCKIKLKETLTSQARRKGTRKRKL
jgi:hypothetical protein